MLAMDTTGPLEYDKTDGSLLIYIYLFVQKFTQNYKNRTSNTRKYWMDPVRRNVTDKWDKEKTRQQFVIPGIATLLHGSQGLFVHMVYSVMEGQTAWHGY